jgi:rhodanese-related sulfurtransferase
LDADLVILSAGVRPEIALAKQAGLAIGAKGGIRVDAQMRTSDPRIWAAGDAVESLEIATGTYGVVPLAGPANRQGRIAADSICGRDSRFRGVQGTAVCGVMGLTIASTGASEKTLCRLGITAYEKIYSHPESHAGYYPGAARIHIKLLFSTEDGRILGAQAIGTDGAEKRIDIIAMAMQMRATVFDLEEAELCYAPQYGSAKDPVNMAGMAAANVLRGDVQLASWEGLADSPALIVDVREPKEFAKDHVEGAINVPLTQLRQRLHELPKDRDIYVYCVVGQRSYNASRILRQNGYRVRNLPGGINTYLRLPKRMLSRAASTGG